METIAEMGKGSGHANRRYRAQMMAYRASGKYFHAERSRLEIFSTRCARKGMRSAFGKEAWQELKIRTTIWPDGRSTRWHACDLVRIDVANGKAEEIHAIVVSETIAAMLFLERFINVRDFKRAIEDGSHVIIPDVRFDTHHYRIAIVPDEEACHDMVTIDAQGRCIE